MARRRADGTYVWYPPGLLTAWLTGYALAGIGAAMLLLGGPEALHESLRGVLGTVLDRMYGSRVPNRDDVAATLALIIPGVVAASWMVTDSRQRRAGAGRARPLWRELASVAAV